MLETTFSCNHFPKKFKLTFDGGVLGNYHLKLCNPCYTSHDKKFLIKEMTIHEK